MNSFERVRKRWWFHLLLLAAYPIVIGILSAVPERRGSETLLPARADELAWMIALELGLFTAVFAAAWLASRATREELLLVWRGGLAPVWRGFLYSIGLRLFIAVILMALAAVLILARGAQPESLQVLRPRTEALVNAEALVQDPVYLALSMTVLSFVVGGFREELWRAGMLAAFQALSPERFRSLCGRMAAVSSVAIVFGLGHLPQGWAGVGFTSLLGLGLGAIMIWRRSIWEAVFAHGFFNATSFLLLFLVARFAPEALPAP